MMPTDQPVEQEQALPPIASPWLRGWIALLCLAGGFLLLWPYQDDRSLWWYRCHLETLDSQLQGLKELLQDYKCRHERYPTNDEGLAALDNYESRFILTYYRNREESRWNTSSGFCSDGRSRLWGQASKESLEEYRNAHGRTPQTADEFRRTRLGMGFGERMPSNETEAQPTKVEIGIDRRCNVFLLDRSGVLSPWLLPYLYENRAGCRTDAFQGALADGDRWGYSVKVDDGVYVSSTGGYLYAQEHNRTWWERNGPRFFGGLLLLCGGAVAVYGVFRARLARPLWAVAAVVPGFLVGGFFHAMNSATCYIMSEIFSRRTPKMVSLQLELLEKYRAQGVISEETYRRAASAAQREKFQPTEDAGNRPK